MMENNKELMDLMDVHKLLLYLIINLNYISEQTGIPYYAHAGTLLGALRHKGFIPWDDDVDVMIERKNYYRFIEACKHHLPDELIIRCRETDPYFCEEYIKICFKDDDCEYSELSLDVFVLDDTDPKRKLFRFFQNKIIRILRPVKLYKVSRIAPYMNKYIPHNAVKRFILALAQIIPIKMIDRIQIWAMTAERHNTDYYVDWGSIDHYTNVTYDKSLFATNKKTPFENTYVYVVEQDIDMVEHVYHATPWRELPPPEKRKSHDVHLIHHSLCMEHIDEIVSKGYIG